MTTPKRQRRLKAHKRAVRRIDTQTERLRRTSRILDWIRWIVLGLSVFSIAAVNHFLGTPVAFTAFVLVFILIWLTVHAQNRLRRGIEKRQRSRMLKTAQIARLSLDWEALPERNISHAKESDYQQLKLSLSGERSLHTLIDTTSSKGGSERLRQLLTNNEENVKQVWRRQRIVQELTTLTGFRNRLALNASAINDSRLWDLGTTIHWLNWSIPEKSDRKILFFFCIFSSLNVTLACLNWLSLIPAVWAITFPVYLLLYYGLYATDKVEDIGALHSEAATLRGALQPFKEVLRLLESFNIGHKPNICEFLAEIRDRESPSLTIGKIDRLMGRVSIQIDLYPIINAVLPWDLYHNHRLNALKCEVRELLPQWLDVWYEIDALGALANLTYVDPDRTVFPDVLQFGRGTKHLVEANGMHHPLIEPSRSVANDFTISKGTINIITGSNMSGKSSFLISIGMNLRLAQAGGPVTASRFKCVLVRLLTCLDVSDSVTEDTSYFRAEARCLKLILDGSEGRHDAPMVFLIDEILRGTNHRERLLGSKAFLSTILRNGGTGIVSTHELDLAKWGQSRAEVRNFHFQDVEKEGRMVFDYTIQAGPALKTNALKVLQEEGLPVEEDQA